MITSTTLRHPAIRSKLMDAHKAAMADAKPGMAGVSTFDTRSGYFGVVYVGGAFRVHHRSKLGTLQHLEPEMVAAAILGGAA